MSSIGERLREERDRLGFNQTAFGAIGGVQKQAQLKYEKGERMPDAAYLEAVAKVGADVQYVITGQRSAAALSTDEEELLVRFRAAPLAVKAAAIGALQGAAGAVRVDKRVSVSAPGGHAAGRDMTIERK
ncbi:MAG: helix-turn-helix domain-containing protein [Pseudomonadaceae bacterium]